MKTEENTRHFLHIMLYYFKKGKNATEPPLPPKKKTHAVYGEGAVTDRTCEKGFVKFCTGDFSLDDPPWSVRRPVEVDSHQIDILRTINIIPCRR